MEKEEDNVLPKPQIQLISSLTSGLLLAAEQAVTGAPNASMHHTIVLDAIKARKNAYYDSSNSDLQAEIPLQSLAQDNAPARRQPYHLPQQ